MYWLTWIINFLLLFPFDTGTTIMKITKITKITKLQSNFQRIILISIDGFRWDYKQRGPMPNLRKLAEKGVTASRVLNVFPTNTFPNHYTIVTGLYPGHHGIIDNNMFEPNYKNPVFTMGNTDPEWWNEAEPIWVTNQRQGHESGVCYWPGYDVEIKGIRPLFRTSKIANSKLVTPKEKADIVIKWLTKNKAINFAALYSLELDHAAHDFGPDYDDVKREKKLSEVLLKVDEMIGYLMDRLEETSNINNTNIIIIGDHGHVNVNHTGVIQLQDYIDLKQYAKNAFGFTNCWVYPKEGQLHYIYKKLKHAHPHMQVILREELPEFWHIKKNNRTAPLLLLPDPGWMINNTIQDMIYQEGAFFRGEHGYSNLIRDMNPGFFAFGPAFKPGAKIPFMETVDLYSLMCRILRIKPLKHDGDFDRVKHLLKE